MEEYVTRLEYDEHNRRTDDEHRRINRRMEIVEESVRQIGELTASVREMAVSMNSMAKEQGKMSERLDSHLHSTMLLLYPVPLFPFYFLQYKYTFCLPHFLHISLLKNLPPPTLQNLNFP